MKGGKTNRAKIFLYSLLFFIFGIALASFIPALSAWPALWWFGAVAVAAVAVALLWADRKARIACLFAFACLFGVWRYRAAGPIASPGEVRHYNGQSAVLIAAVDDEPQQRASNQRLTADCEQALIGGAWRDVSGRILVYTDSFPAMAYGDRLRIEGGLAAPAPFDGFAYDRYLARHGIHSLAYYPAIERLSAGEGGLFFSAVIRLKAAIRGTFRRNLDPPYAGLAQAMVLGDKQDIPERLRIDFSRAGISHIMAISGMHVGIITAMILLVLREAGLGRRLTYYLSLLFLLAYVVLAGMPASAVRAGIMGALVLSALHVGRLSSLKHSLALAAALMLAFNPLLLRDDIGWQLSFLSVLGIVYLYPPLSRGLDKAIPAGWLGPAFRRNLCSVAGLTLAANLATWPLVAHYFSVVSLVSPLANLMVLWTLPFLFALLGLGLALSFFPLLSFLVFKGAELALFYIIAVAAAAGAHPLAYRQLEGFDWRHLGWYYLLLAAAVAAARLDSARRLIRF